MTDLSPYRLSWLRIIHLAPGLKWDRYDILKTTITELGDLVIFNEGRLNVSEKGLALLQSLGLRVFGRKQNDMHELELRDRMASLQLIERGHGN